jgi:(R,R)-butanediol dehydrogenase / meso-butanediol dehydrogenase / diacetyl reductase
VQSVEVAADRRLVSVSSEEPAPGPGQALIEVAHCGICGSDLHFRDVPELFPAGTVPGHEFSGRIGAVGEGVDGWALGTRVCVLPFAQCGECAVCRSGNEQVCLQAVPNGVGLGTGRPGGYAEKVIVDERMLFALPEGVDDRAGTLVEPLAVAVRAVATAAVPPSEPVVVIGAGPIGLLTGLVLRERGYRRALILSRNPRRETVARRLGLSTVSLEELRSAPVADAPACVWDCAGTPSSAQLGVELLRPLGQLMLVGLSLAPLDLPAPAVVLKELNLRGVIAYRRSEFQQAIDLLATGRIPTDELITDVRPLDQAEEAFQALTGPGTEQLKIILAP